jgi:hypothetical protein
MDPLAEITRLEARMAQLNAESARLAKELEELAEAAGKDPQRSENPDTEQTPEALTAGES